MDAMTTKEVIRKFVVQKLAKKKEHMHVLDNEDIITAGIVDSLAMMHLVMFIEETFSVTIKDEDLIPDNFDSIDSITSFVERVQ